MYKKKRWICVAWLLVMMLLLCACGNLETEKNQGEVAENDKIQIGMSLKDGRGIVTFSSQRQRSWERK